MPHASTHVPFACVVIGWSRGCCAAPRASRLASHPSPTPHSPPSAHGARTATCGVVARNAEQNSPAEEEVSGGGAQKGGGRGGGEAWGAMRDQSGQGSTVPSGRWTRLGQGLGSAGPRSCVCIVWPDYRSAREAVGVRPAGLYVQVHACSIHYHPSSSLCILVVVHWLLCIDESRRRAGGGVV
jgi:hypothetical protein